VRTDEPLIDAWWKTERAKHHLKELWEQINSFMADDPVTVAVIDDKEQRVRRYQAVFKQPHVWFFLIAGDIFQCLRTALDQAVWWLASAQYKDPDWTQFPIFAENTPKNRERFTRQTRGVPTKSIDVIESVQPYNRETGALLNAPGGAPVQIGDPNERAHPLVNGAPQRRRSPMGGGPIHVNVDEHGSY
jgi:hypothetical protein